MPKSIFDQLSGNTKKSVLLNKSKTVKITGYADNAIEYMGTAVFKVTHNDCCRDVLFFITNVNDTKVILGSKSCQEFNLVTIMCDSKCWCKSAEMLSINKEFPVGLSVPNEAVRSKVIPAPVDPNTKIEVNDPKGHILCLFPELFEGVGTMEDVSVHLDVNPEVEPVVQAPRKIPNQYDGTTEDGD